MASSVKHQRQRKWQHNIIKIKISEIMAAAKNLESEGEK